MLVTQFMLRMGIENSLGSGFRTLVPFFFSMKWGRLQRGLLQSHSSFFLVTEYDFVLVSVAFLLEATSDSATGGRNIRVVEMAEEGATGDAEGSGEESEDTESGEEEEDVETSEVRFAPEEPDHCKYCEM